MLWQQPPLWTVGLWPPAYVRTIVQRDGPALAVFGPCSATDAELAQLLSGLPDSASTDWSGAYTTVRVGQDRQLTILTDPAGACPIYTTRDHDGALVWGSSSRALAGLTGCRVDDEWLAASLANPNGALSRRSAWAGVATLPSGCRTVVSADGPLTVIPAWQPPDGHVADAVPRLRETLAAGIRTRVESASPAADLSGGLDSTVLAVLAARFGPVMGVTVHPAGVETGGDLDHARIAAAANRDLHHVILSLDDRHLPFAGVGRVDGIPPTDEPAPSALTWARLSAQLEMMRLAGIDCHLTGDGGDTVFRPPPVYLADLAQRRRWLRLAADAQDWARLRRVSPWPLVAAAVRANAATLSAGGPSVGLTAHALQLSANLPATDHTPGLGHADVALLAEVRQVARTAHAETQLADTFGIMMHNPYLDSRVLDIVMSVPAQMRASARRYKPLLNEVADGLLPESVRLRAAKGVFVADHHQGLRANLDNVLALADGHLAERGLVEPTWLRNHIRRAALGLDTPWGRLEPLLGAELWLRTIATAPPIAWTRRDTANHPDRRPAPL